MSFPGQISWGPRSCRTTLCPMRKRRAPPLRGPRSSFGNCRLCHHIIRKTIDTFLLLQSRTTSNGKIALLGSLLMFAKLWRLVTKSLRVTSSSGIATVYGVNIFHQVRARSWAILEVQMQTNSACSCTYPPKRLAGSPTVGEKEPVVHTVSEGKQWDNACPEF